MALSSPKCAIFASGRGSNALNLIKFLSSSKIFDFELLLTDRGDAQILEEMKKIKHEEKSFFINPKEFKSREEYDESIGRFLREKKIEWVFLAGFMRILGDEFLKYFYDEKIEKFKIINIHPSFLPDHKGLYAYEKSFKSRDPYGGITVHFVNDQLDGGEVILQEKFDKFESDSLEDFIKRGLRLEHEIYPRALEYLYQQYILNKG